MKILITGINGFVGSNFVNSWQDNYTLSGVDIKQEDKKGVNKIFSWEQLKDIPTIDAIIHLAGVAHDTKDNTKSDIYFQINTGLTQKIFDYFLQSEAKKFIFFSSVKAAADSVNGDFLTEEIVPTPIGPYGESKIRAEEYILSKQKEYEALGKRVYIVRPCMIHGKGNKGNLNLLYRLVSKGLPWPLGAFENKRSFCYVENMIYVVENLIQKDIESGIYHVGDDEPLSTNELIKLISQSVGKKARIWEIPKNLMGACAKIGGCLHLPLNKDRLQKLTENYVVSNQKIKNALKIKKMPFSAQEGMTKTLDSFKLNK